MKSQTRKVEGARRLRPPIVCVVGRYVGDTIVSDDGRKWPLNEYLYGKGLGVIAMLERSRGRWDVLNMLEFAYRRRTA